MIKLKKQSKIRETNVICTPNHPNHPKEKPLKKSLERYANIVQILEQMQRRNDNADWSEDFRVIIPAVRVDDYFCFHPVRGPHWITCSFLK